MPLPRDAEDAAARVDRILRDFDDDIAVYVATGGPPPSPAEWVARLERWVTIAVAAAVRQIDPEVTVAELAALIADQVAELESVLVDAVSDARVQRRRAPTTPPVRDDDESVVALIARVGAVAALVALVAEVPARRRRRQARRIARQVRGRVVPAPTAARARMIVRTRTATQRNERAATVADRDQLVILVRDGRRGPTDEACERVDGRYATAAWLRAHPVEHPNCTRLGRPVRLPDGARVTLLS